MYKLARREKHASFVQTTPGARRKAHRLRGGRKAPRDASVRARPRKAHVADEPFGVRAASHAGSPAAGGIGGLPPVLEGLAAFPEQSPRDGRQDRQDEAEHKGEDDDGD